MLALLTGLGGGAAYAAVETEQDLTTWDGVWWALVTVITVGYGDTYPRTETGRAIAIVVMLVGIGFVAVLTAAAAERFIRRQRLAKHRRWEYRRPMEIALLIVAIIVAAVLLSRSPLVRSHGEATEAEMRAVAGGANVEKQFKRPPDEGGLL